MVLFDVYACPLFIQTLVSSWLQVFVLINIKMDALASTEQSGQGAAEYYGVRFVYKLAP